LKKILRPIAIAVVAMLFFAACGDDDGEASTELDVVADSFTFNTDGWTVEGNTDITVNFSNDSDVDEHEWAVLNEGVTITSEDEFAEELVLTEIEAIAPGDSTTETFNFAPGTYQVICALEGHFDSGMTATLTVEG
jgi:uncharacterized cupredoxin-like copper-binding protein